LAVTLKRAAAVVDAHPNWAWYEPGTGWKERVELARADPKAARRTRRGWRCAQSRRRGHAGGEAELGPMTWTMPGARSRESRWEADSSRWHRESRPDCQDRVKDCRAAAGRVTAVGTGVGGGERRSGRRTGRHAREQPSKGLRAGALVAMGRVDVDQTRGGLVGRPDLVESVSGIASLQAGAGDGEEERIAGVRGSSKYDGRSASEGHAVALLERVVGAVELQDERPASTSAASRCRARDGGSPAGPVARTA